MHLHCICALPIISASFVSSIGLRVQFHFRKWLIGNTEWPSASSLFSLGISNL